MPANLRHWTTDLLPANTEYGLLSYRSDRGSAMQKRPDNMSGAKQE